MKKYKFSTLNSIKLILNDIFNTQVIKGSKSMYTIARICRYVCVIVNNYKLQKIIKSMLNKKPTSNYELEKTIKKYLNKYLNLNMDKELIIKNEIGIFYGNLCDDSFTQYSPTYEYYLQHWFDYDKRKEFFLDIGANRGRYSIQAINIEGYKKVYAFEPLSYNLRYLTKNIELNNLNDKITVFPCALSDFIKIDVEGHEYRVLKGADNFLDYLEKETYLMIEILEDSKNREKTVNFLEEKGFKLIEVDDYTQTNYLYL